LLIGLGLALLALAAWLVLSAFRQNMMHFYTPSQVLTGQVPAGSHFHIGGMVVKGSLVHEPDGLTVQFVVTDLAHTVPVRYSGILPDLFKEGKGVVAQGRLNTDQVFVADEVLAKHDENYMPPNAAYALKQGAAIDKAKAP
jgi:cytochrome c-type biogenesis protein CcmE